jgi:tol-pal system protein YbgF
MKNKILALTLALLASTASYGQNASTERLEQRLMVLEQKLFSSTTSHENAAPSGSLLADFEARLQILEEESRQVYGAVEELGNTVKGLAETLEKLAEDNDLRLQDIENAIATKMAIKKSLSGSLGGSNDEITELLNANIEAEKVPVKKSELSAQKLFDKGYDAITRASYSDALQSFKEFSEVYADHELAGEAFYWLGEVYLVKDNPEKAAVAFSTGLTKDPKGGKAPSNLLKMGYAFKQLEQADMARGSWQKLIEDYPNSEEADEARQELDAL